ncbi:NUDIX hydrolase [Acinetobacter boissieri]|uniref:NUDIX domain-containing protein n=1 Tax=Acinetobacter boissieri TaxID=1219383 RepID=A0A1G6GH37_9GAMM|nr:NUDIX domain-containing protein [Acinetobacter boissieri]SDB81328.1 NUDIX domain-containing protein [Acinetobacter boissieri]
MTVVEKVVPIIFRNFNQNIEILVFRHPIAGIQIVKGTVEANEKLEDAAIRELYEESGISSASIDSYLGLHHPSELKANWHVFVCHTTEDLKDSWVHSCNDDGGLEFNFFWHPLAEEPTDEWHQIFKELLEFIKSRY